jgi:hypothetical protein
MQLIRAIASRLAKDYDEVAHDIETGANEIRHAELLDGGSPSYWRLGSAR